MVTKFGFLELEFMNNVDREVAGLTLMASALSFFLTLFVAF